MNSHLKLSKKNTNFFFMDKKFDQRFYQRRKINDKYNADSLGNSKLKL